MRRGSIWAAGFLVVALAGLLAWQLSRSDPGVVRYSGQDGRTVLELLEERAKVQTESTSLGLLVRSIDGRSGGTEGRYWIYLVDGQFRSEPPGKLETRTGQTVEWRLTVPESAGPAPGAPPGE